jgi:hypothetical protein
MIEDISRMPRYPSLEYLGGFFDGEGSIGIFSSSLCARVTNTDLHVLEAFLAEWGGSIVPHTAAGPKRKECHQWKCYGQNAEDALTDLFPHLREKRMQAFMGIEYRRLLPKDPKRPWIEREISTLKHLGRKKTTPWSLIGAL